MNTERTVAAKFWRKDPKGVDECATGVMVISDESPSHIFHLAEDFPSDVKDLAEFFREDQEVESYPLLHAQTPLGTFTLVDSALTSYSRNIGGGKLSRLSYRPSFVVDGNLTFRREELEVTEAYVRFWDQDSWANWSFWEINGQGPGEELQVIRRTPEEKSVTFDDVTLELVDASPRLFAPRATHQLTLKQTSYFKLTFTQAVPIKAFMDDWIAPLSFWVSSGARRTGGIDSLLINNRGWTDDATGEPITRFVSVTPKNPKRKFTSEDETQHLHTLDLFEFEGVPTVLTAFRMYRTAIEQYMDWIHSRPTSNLTRFTQMCQLVETFDRLVNPDPKPDAEVEALAVRARDLARTDGSLSPLAHKIRQAVRESGRVTLSHRLSNLDRATDQFVSRHLGSKSWKSDIPLIRNSIVHGLDSSSFFLRNHIPLQIGEEILQILFEVRMLVAMGLGMPVIEKAMTERDPRWYGRKHNITRYLGSFDDFRQYVPERESDAERDADR